MFGKFSVILSKKQKLKFDPFEFLKDACLPSIKDYTFKDFCSPTGVNNEQIALFKSGHLLQRIENWASSAIAKKAEYSYPLLDRRIVEFALAIPEDLFAWKNGYERYLFRKAISGFLPENIVWAPKSADLEHDKKRIKLWYESLKIWMKKNEHNLENKCDYVDRLKIMDRLQLYFMNKKNRVENDISGSTIATSILVSNLKNKCFKTVE